MPELQSRTLAILSYGYTDQLLSDTDHLDSSAASIVAEHQKAKFASEFSSLFKITDVSNNPSVLKGRMPRIDNPELMSEILQEVGADGGILIASDYGYGMSGNLLQAIAEKVLPWFKGLVRTMFGSNVEGYYFASNTYIVDKEGKVVWNFYGKASASPNVEFTIGGLAEAYAGGDPAQQKAVGAMVPITDHYVEYLTWLVQADIGNSSNKNYFTDYPKEKRDKHINVYPASDKHYPPSVSGTNQ